MFYFSDLRNLRMNFLFEVVQMGHGTPPESVRFSDTWCESRRLKCVFSPKTDIISMHKQTKTVPRYAESATSKDGFQPHYLMLTS